jgi:hypothetical protein
MSLSGAAAPKCERPRTSLIRARSARRWQEWTNCSQSEFSTSPTRCAPGAGASTQQSPRSRVPAATGCRSCGISPARGSARFANGEVPCPLRSAWRNWRSRVPGGDRGQRCRCAPFRVWPRNASRVKPAVDTNNPTSRSGLIPPRSSAISARVTLPLLFWRCLT